MKCIAVETVGDLRKVLASIPDDVPLEFNFDDMTYGMVDVIHCNVGREDAYILIEPYGIAAKVRT